MCQMSVAEPRCRLYENVCRLFTTLALSGYKKGREDVSAAANQKLLVPVAPPPPHPLALLARLGGC